jgi:hypothetical protein
MRVMPAAGSIDRDAALPSAVRLNAYHDDVTRPPMAELGWSFTGVAFFVSPEWSSHSKVTERVESSDWLKSYREIMGA